MKFKFACTGGTFDRIHKGHEALLRHAFASAGRVLIGLTSDAMVRRTKNFFEIAKTYPQRRRELSAFLRKNGFSRRAVVVKLNDVCGPSVEKTDAFDCIVTSRKTLDGAREINARRRKNGLKPLKIVLVRTVKSQDAKSISSTRVRKGQIDRAGTVFGKAFAKTLSLTPAATAAVKRPFGKVVRNSVAFRELRRLKPFKVIAVGDATAKLFERAPAELKPLVVVVDGRIKRRKTLYEPKGVFDMHFMVSNKPGTISRKAASIVEKAVEAKNHDTCIIRVKGEEDLLALPAVLFAPLDSIVCYGQPNEGLVVTKVTEGKKREALAIARKMRT